jgi:hypothetical protein
MSLTKMPPGWGQLGGQPALAPECTPEVLVMREDGCARQRPRRHVLPRVYLTIGNRLAYRGNRPYRPGPVTVSAGYQSAGLKFFEFEFQKLKNAKKPKNTT